MKYCARCGNQLVDEAMVCPNCGCMTGKMPAPAVVSAPAPASANKKMAGSWLPLVFSILGWNNLFFFVLYYFDVSFGCVMYNMLGTSVAPLLGLLSAIVYLKGDNKVCPILGLIFSCMAIFVKFILVVICGVGRFYW